MTRVIQWATGVTGMMSLRHVIGRQDLELVGVRVYDETKAGVDAGTLCGAGEIGLLTTLDRDDIINTDADVVLYMGKVETDTPGCFADVCDLLSSGKNVIATGSRFIHPRSLHDSLADGIQNACRTGCSSFLGLGLYPGFFGESLAPILSRFHKLYPAVSPAKTVEGAVGGVLAGLLVMLGARATFVPWLTVGDCLLAALPAGVIGPTGDLVESLIKRAFGVKDSGRLIPGHGGMLDRIDALLFVSAWLYVYALYLR